MRGTQPTEPERHARIIRTNESNFFSVRTKQTQSQKYVGVCGLRGQPQFRGNRAGDFDAPCHRRGTKSQAITGGLIGQCHGFWRRLWREKQAVRVQEVFRPLRPGGWPLVFAAKHEFLVWMANIQRDARLFVPTGVFAFEEVAEKPPLQSFAILAVEMREVSIAVHL